MADSSVRIEIDGLGQLRRDLRAAGDDLADLKDAHAAVADHVAAAAAARAPRGDTGALAGSIRGNRAAGKATVNAGGARLPYAGPVHYGWPAHGIEAHPFIADAAQQTESQWLPMYVEAIDEVTGKLAGHTYD